LFSIVAAQQPQKTKYSQSPTEQAGDPMAPMDQYQLLWTIIPETYGADGWGQSAEFQAVEFFTGTGFLPVQLARITVPFIINTPGSDHLTGLGDIVLFDQFVLLHTRSISFGIGPAMVMPTAVKPALGQGKWQAGISFGFLNAEIKNFQLGFIIENLRSFAGDSGRPDVRAMTIQPVINYIHNQWYLGAGDFITSFDWTTGNISVPLALQLGYVTRIGKFHYNFSIETVYWAKYEIPSPKWGIRIGFVLLDPLIP
jgi:hypothetical protein